MFPEKNFYFLHVAHAYHSGSPDEPDRKGVVSCELKAVEEIRVEMWRLFARTTKLLPRGLLVAGGATVVFHMQYLCRCI